MENGREVNINTFAEYLRSQEKSRNTVEKYIRDVRHFFRFLGENEIDREFVLRHKEELQKEYKPSSVNSMLVALNVYLKFIGKPELKVQVCRIQREIFRSEEKELTKEAQKLYDILIEKSSSYIADMEKQLADADEENKVFLEFLLYMQYKNANNTKKADVYRSLYQQHTGTAPQTTA